MADYSKTVYILSIVAVVVALFTFVLVIMADSRSRVYGTVTQGTSAVTKVTIPKRMGVITTVPLTAAPGAEVKFQVECGEVKKDSVVIVSVEYPSTGAGSPVVHVSDVVSGSFMVGLRNVGSAAMNAATKVHYRIF